MNLVKFAVLAGTLFCSLVSGAAEHAEADPFARDLLIITQWFAGEFDNEEQVWFERDPRSKTPEDLRHERIHTTHVRIDAPEFGEHVFYVEEYKGNDPLDIVRQRFVVFSSMPDSSRIRMRQGFFREAKKFIGAQNNLEAFNDLSAEDVFFLDECDVYWRRVAGQFQGAMTPKACVFGEGAKRRYSVHDLYLSADKYWRVDTTYLVSDDSLHIGFPPDLPYKLRRAERFECSVTFRPRSEKAQAVSGLGLHSQGGSFDVTRQSDGQGFTVLMREKEYPYYSDRPDFIYFSVRKQGEEASVVFTVNDANSRQLGVSNGDFMVYCYLEGYQFRESFEQLLSTQ